MNIWLVVSSKVNTETGKMVWEGQDAIFSITLEGPDGIPQQDSVKIHMIMAPDDVG
jgi:hypothetical protein